MAKQLNSLQEQMMIGRTKRLLDQGKDQDFIVKELKRPIAEVKKWIDICKDDGK